MSRMRSSQLSYTPLGRKGQLMQFGAGGQAQRWETHRDFGGRPSFGEFQISNFKSQISQANGELVDFQMELGALSGQSLQTRAIRYCLEMPEPKHILFLCSANRMRSPTAETVFQDWPGIEVASAGLNIGAEVELTPEFLARADFIFVMDKSQRDLMTKKFIAQLKGQRVICLQIPDEFAVMDPELMELLRRRVTPHLPPPWPREAKSSE